ncbi:MAG: ATP-binding cassette domain-containing protein [Chitinophagales bacterium]
MISIHQLTKRYHNQPVLHQLNAEFEEGKIYGVVGANGAGKTTWFRCMAGLENYEGTVTAPVQPLKNAMGFLPAEPAFFDKVTGEEYVRMVAAARQEDVLNLEERNVFELPLQQYASTYSTGMKKKLALWAILLLPNQYYILDEPFNGVDIQSNLMITEVVMRLAAMGKTVFLSSHIFATLSETCHHILLLEEGRITQWVNRADFGQLEAHMRSVSIAGKVDQLGLL